ncbi:hypothetical protein AU190_00905 [Mycolicibacterium acapulense]|nr:hypothetical protein AU190_00905 [Mycolicibacterium acapulense]
MSIAPVTHHRITVDGVDTFYRQAGPSHAPVVLAEPERVAGLVIQNGDIYADAFGPKYGFLRELWDNPGPAGQPHPPA